MVSESSNVLFLVGILTQGKKGVSNQLVGRMWIFTLMRINNKKLKILINFCRLVMMLWIVRNAYIFLEMHIEMRSEMILCPRLL